MANKFFHIGFSKPGTPLTKDERERLLNLADDWLFYAPNCWLVYTDKDAEWWATAMHNALGKDASVLVLEINLSNSYGWLTKDLWEWFGRSRS